MSLRAAAVALVLGEDEVSEDEVAEDEVGEVEADDVLLAPRETTVAASKPTAGIWLVTLL